MKRKPKGREPLVLFRAPAKLIERIDRKAVELSSRSAAIRFLIEKGFDIEREQRI